jgi:methionyl-tRNA formyltransferase
MKIVFIGTVEFSSKALRVLLELNANIVGVVTKENSVANADHVDLSLIARENNILYKYVNDINHPNNVAWIAALQPDVIFCFGWSSLIKKELLTLPRLGVIGYHPALLPFNRGRHPIIWALALGLSKTGSTFFFMDEGADTGDVLDQEEITIDPSDDARVLYDKVVSSAIDQVRRFFPKLLNGTYTRQPQDRSYGNTWRKRGKADGAIDFRMSSESIVNLVRALSKPYVGAHCTYQGNDVKIWAARKGMCMEKNWEPGKVVALREGTIEVKTGDASVILSQHEFLTLPQIDEYIL